MIYEPENLKNKRAIYEKRDKWLIRLAFLFWAVLLLIYVNIVIPYVKSTIGFLGIIVGGIAVITIVYFFTVPLHRQSKNQTMSLRHQKQMQV